jgi:hypothetical protein
VDPETRTALDAHRAGGVRWLGGGAIAVVLGVLLEEATSAGAGNGHPVVDLAVVALLLVGVIASVVGAGALVRTWRWRRGLARTEWRHGRLWIGEPTIMAFEPAGYDEQDPDHAPVPLRLLSTALWRTRAVQRLDGAEVRAAPVGGGQWVFTADGLGTVYGAGVVRRR